jgi:hypothetical protein
VHVSDRYCPLSLPGVWPKRGPRATPKGVMACIALTLDTAPWWARLVTGEPLKVPQVLPSGDPALQPFGAPKLPLLPPPLDGSFQPLTHRQPFPWRQVDHQAALAQRVPREVMPPSRFRSSTSASVVPRPAGSRVPSHRYRGLGFRADAASGAVSTAGWRLSASHPSPNLPLAATSGTALSSTGSYAR